MDQLFETFFDIEVNLGQRNVDAMCSSAEFHDNIDSMKLDVAVCSSKYNVLSGVLPIYFN